MPNDVRPLRFHEELKQNMDSFVHTIYDFTMNFPKEELYGLTSQIRRASLSIILNYIEGYARQRKQVLKNFLEISYGSLKETKYLLYFSYKRNMLTKKQYDTNFMKAEKIGRMLWGTLSKM